MLDVKKCRRSFLKQLISQDTYKIHDYSSISSLLKARANSKKRGKEYILDNIKKDMSSRSYIKKICHKFMRIVAVGKF